MAAQLSFFFFFLSLVIFIGLIIAYKRELKLKKQDVWILCNDYKKEKFDYSNVIEVAYEPCD